MAKKEKSENLFEELMHNGRQPEVDVAYSILPRFYGYLSEDHASIELVHHDGYRILRDPPVSAVIRADGSYSVNCYISLPSQLYTCERRLVEWITKGKFTLRRLKRAAAHGLWFEPLEGEPTPMGKRILTGGKASFTPTGQILTYNEPLNRVMNEEAVKMIKDLIEAVRVDTNLRARLGALNGEHVKGEVPNLYWADGNTMLTALKKVKTTDIRTFKPLVSTAMHRYGTRYDYVNSQHVKRPVDKAVDMYLRYVQNKILHDTGAIKYA